MFLKENLPSESLTVDFFKTLIRTFASGIGIPSAETVPLIVD